MSRDLDRDLELVRLVRKLSNAVRDLERRLAALEQKAGELDQEAQMHRLLG